MFNYLKRVRPSAYITASLLAIFMTPAVAKADWVGLIGPRDEAPAGQVYESGLADIDGNVEVIGGDPNPGAIITFRGTGMLYVEAFRSDYSVINQRRLTWENIGVRLFTGFRPQFPESPPEKELSDISML